LHSLQPAGFDRRFQGGFAMQKTCERESQEQRRFWLMPWGDGGGVVLMDAKHQEIYLPGDVVRDVGDVRIYAGEYLRIMADSFDAGLLARFQGTSVALSDGRRLRSVETLLEIGREALH
jgi:hypothetical protein